MKRGWLLLAMCVAACGDPREDDPPPGDRLIRASLGAAESDGIHLYAFAVRVSSVRVKMSSGRDITSGPTNVDVLRGGLLFEVRGNATPTEIELRFEEPPQGSGVVPGARVAAYLSCSIGGERFDYYGEELDDVRLAISGEDIALRFDLAGLLDGVSDFEDPAPHRIDEDHNDDIAELLEERIAASLRVCDACD